MAEIIRKTESTYFGPWLLDKTALDELDEIINEQWERLEGHKKQQIDNAVRRERGRLSKLDSNPERSEDESKVKVQEIRQRLENDYTDDGRTITLTLSSGNKVRVNSFHEAVNEVNCQDHEVAKVDVKICCGGIRGDLVVPTRDKNHGHSLVTLPEASNEAVELFVKLNRWSEENKPDWFRRLRGLPGFYITFLNVLLILLIFVIGVVTGFVSEKNTWKDEVRKLVAKGVKPEDYGRALELLLWQSAGLHNDAVRLIAPAWFVVAAITLVIIVGVWAILLLAVPARTAFEIGKGATSVRRQKWYDSLLRKTIPGFLIMGVLASIVGTVVLELFRSKWSK